MVTRSPELVSTKKFAISERKPVCTGDENSGKGGRRLHRAVIRDTGADVEGEGWMGIGDSGGASTTSREFDETI